MEYLLGADAYDFLRKYGLPIVDFKEIESETQVSRLSTPCVLKVPGILHKTEKGAVKIIHCAESLPDVYKTLTKLGSVIWQPFIDGRELIIGIKNDPTFGPTLMFGIGGVYTELYKDVTFRVCPITKKDAEAMISEVKGAKLLDSFRGQKPVNKSSLIAALLKISKLAMREPIEELDINPYIINNKIGQVVDARIVLR